MTNSNVEVEVKDGVAVYTGPMDAFQIIEAMKSVQRRAATETIESFEVTIPNTEFNQLGVFTKLEATRGFRILGSGDGETTIGCRFVRRVVHAVEVAVEEVKQRDQPAVPTPMDLAGRRIV